MSCERAVEENSLVVVQFPPSWSDRRRACGESWRARRRACCESCRARSRACCNVCRNVCDPCVKPARKVSLCLCGGCMCLSPFWIMFLLQVYVIGYCVLPLELSLVDVNMRNMLVYQNTTDSPYQVRSEFSLNLSAWNMNKEHECHFTFLRMSVSVEFKGQQIVQQEVPLGFELKPEKSRTVMLDLRGDGYPLKKESALLLDLELRNSSGMGLTIFFESQAMDYDRKSKRIRRRCETVTRTQPNNKFSLANSTHGLVWSSCKYNTRY